MSKEINLFKLLHRFVAEFPATVAGKGFIYFAYWKSSFVSSLFGTACFLRDIY